MLAQAVRNTAQPERPPKLKRDRGKKAPRLIPECKNFGWRTQSPASGSFDTNGLARPRRDRFLCAYRTYAKVAKVSLDGSCVAFLGGGTLRRFVIERGAPSCLDALPQ
jgi:hypothetical protein